MSGTTNNQEPKSDVRYRLAIATAPSNVGDITYMMQLMGALEAMNAALRWGVLLDKTNERDFNVQEDRIMVFIAWAGWCAEAIRLLKHGEKDGLVSRSMLRGHGNAEALWDRIFKEGNGDPVVNKIHRIRDFYFAHFHQTVMHEFVRWQENNDCPDPFFVGDQDGNPLNCRFTWPLGAALLDLHGDPKEGTFATRVAKLRDSLENTLVSTGELLRTLISAWVKAAMDAGHLQPYISRAKEDKHR